MYIHWDTLFNYEPIQDGGVHIAYVVKLHDFEENSSSSVTTLVALEPV